MQTNEAADLRKKWGEKKCSHPKTEKEYYLGSDTGDRVCTTCGRDVDRTERILKK